MRQLGLRPHGFFRNGSDSRRARKGQGHSGRADDSGAGDGAVLKTRLNPKTDKIHSSPAGELLTERGMSPLQYLRRHAMTKKLEMARPVKTNEIGFLKALGRYRERVDVEIGKASEHGARWWSRRLVEVYEEAGLVRLEK